VTKWGYYNRRRLTGDLPPDGEWRDWEKKPNSHGKGVIVQDAPRISHLTHRNTHIQCW